MYCLKCKTKYKTEFMDDFHIFTDNYQTDIFSDK